MTVILLNNALAAAILSGASICLGVLYAFGYLPVWDFGAEFRSSGAGVSGVASCRKSIFLDVLCIDQMDKGKKAEALLSMGAFLKRSKSLIIFGTQLTQLDCGVCLSSQHICTAVREQGHDSSSTRPFWDLLSFRWRPQRERIPNRTLEAVLVLASLQSSSVQPNHYLSYLMRWKKWKSF